MATLLFTKDGRRGAVGVVSRTLKKCRGNDALSAGKTFTPQVTLLMRKLGHVHTTVQPGWRRQRRYTQNYLFLLFHLPCLYACRTCPGSLCSPVLLNVPLIHPAFPPLQTSRRTESTRVQAGHTRLRYSPSEADCRASVVARSHRFFRWLNNTFKTTFLCLSEPFVAVPSYACTEYSFQEHISQARSSRAGQRSFPASQLVPKPST